MKGKLLILFIVISTTSLFAQKKNISSTENTTADIMDVLIKVKSKWNYFMDDFSDVKYLVRDSLNKICNDDRCVSFLLTDGFLVATYKVNTLVEFDTQIIDLISNQNIIGSIKNKIYVESFDKEKNILIISSEGYDENGRYWQNGTWDFENKKLNLMTKEY